MFPGLQFSFTVGGTHFWDASSGLGLLRRTIACWSLSGSTASKIGSLLLASWGATELGDRCDVKFIIWLSHTYQGTDSKRFINWVCRCVKGSNRSTRRSSEIHRQICRTWNTPMMLELLKRGRIRSLTSWAAAMQSGGKSWQGRIKAPQWLLAGSHFPSSWILTIIRVIMLINPSVVLNILKTIIHH